MANLINNNITLTTEAAKHIEAELSKTKQQDDTVIGLRLGVKKSGCSGYAYVLDWAKVNDTKKYHVFVSHGIDIYVEQEIFDLISGTEIDYVQQGISKIMVFKNPHVTAECGCGESFTVDQDKAQ